MSYVEIKKASIFQPSALIDITKSIKFLHTTDNYECGIALRMIGNGSVAFSSINRNNNTPKLTITYRNLTGLENYNTYSSHSIGNSTGHVNLATGNLTFVVPTLTTTDSLISFVPTLVFNSSLSRNVVTYHHSEVPYTDLQRAAPIGYIWNMRQSVIRKRYVINTSANEQDSYIWSDGDGTEHYFSKNTANKYVDEDGLLLTLEDNDTTLTITDKDKNVMTFSSTPSPDSSSILEAWTLTSIKYSVGNKVIFEYDSLWRPTEIKVQPNGSEAVSMLNIYYTDEGMPAYIENSQTGEAVVFIYSNNNKRFLREFIYAKKTLNTSTSWSSFQNSPDASEGITVTSRLETSHDESISGALFYVKEKLSGIELIYDYETCMYKLTGVTERGGANTYGQSIKYDYYISHTDVYTSGSDDIIDTDDDILTRYSFDSNGRTVSYYSSSKAGDIIYGAKNNKYETQENVKNNIKESVVTGGSATNYILNGGFELLTETGDFQYWTESEWVSIKNSLLDLDDEGQKMAKLQIGDNTYASINQTIFVPAGKYVISFDLKTYKAANADIVLSVTSLADSGLSFSKKFTYDSDWRSAKNRVSANFEVPDCINGGDRLSITISAIRNGTYYTTSSIYIDEVMLEEGIGESDYSLVNAGNFETLDIDSLGNSTVPLTNFWTPYGQSCQYVTTNSLFGTSLKISGGISTQRYVKQRIYATSEERLSGFDKFLEEEELTGQGQTTQPENITYQISGFARSFAAVSSWPQISLPLRGTNSPTFRIRVDVGYFQGSANETLIVSYCFDFLAECTEWQFLSGTFNTGADDKTSGGDYRCVEYIDLYCEYSYQPGSYAAFDNISVICCTDESIARYTYHEDGMIKSASYDYYKEEYEYDENNNLTGLTNNHNEKYVYAYLEGSSLPESEKYYVSDVLKRRTDYTYNSFGQCTQTVTYTEFSGENAALDAEKIISKQTYKDSTKFVGALLTEEDSLGRTIRYFYDEADGKLLATLNEDSGEGTVYIYNSIDRLVTVRPAVYTALSNSYSEVTNAEEVKYTYDARNMLSQITTQSTVYNFTYDSFGNTSSIKAGDSTLATYNYNDYNGKLLSITYGNGLVEEYVYNEVDLISDIWYTKNGVRTKAYSYLYTSDGKTAEFKNNLTNNVDSYTYGTDGRLETVTRYNLSETYANVTEEYGYNDKGWLCQLYRNFLFSFDDTAYIYDSYNYIEYTSDGKIDYITMSYDERFGIVRYNYDDFDRLVEKRYLSEHQPSEYVYQEFENTVSYEYAEFGTNTSLQISKYTSTVEYVGTTEYTYTYDANGNITNVCLNTGEEIRYVYDNLGQLIREDNGHTGYTYVYSYDNAGNITSSNKFAHTAEGVTPTGAIITKTYGYSNDTWGDRLTSFNDQTITYDEIGNPLSYYNGTAYVFEWNGRQLTGATVGSNTYSFTYNDQGLRATKTKDGKTVTYYYSGGMLIAEVSENYAITFIYENDSTPIGMKYYSSSGAIDVYWYEKNLQGDVVAVYGERYGICPTKLVSYTYDAWGNATETYHSGGEYKSVVNNPILYRSYYYDTETGLYYVSSRYYDPEIGRWISPEPNVCTGAFDSGSGLIGYNVYAYCANNPVNFSDHTGEFILTALIVGVVAGAVIGRSIGGTVAYNSAKSSGLEGSDLFWSTAGGVGKGALIGGVAGGLVGATGGVVAAYGATSVAGTAMITATATITAKATEVTALQAKKSTNDGDNGWQIANDSIDSVFSNGGKIISPALTKAGTTSATYVATDLMKHKVVPLGFNTFLHSAGGKVLPYGFAAYAWGHTAYSIFCTDPFARANQRGYGLR